MCPEYSAARSQGAKGADPKLLEAVANCRDRNLSTGIDLSAFHSAASAQDIEDLRLAMGTKTWALYGLSYGTRLALTVAKDFSDTVSSMVLDSPLPHTARYDDESVANYQATLRKLAKACATQPACNDAFPNLASRYFGAVEEAALG